ncbi:MAG: hypothetical protein J6A69_07205 [Clostridia bacterium]|nr:hypothetical protein [Clostridia bacterium]
MRFERKRVWLTHKYREQWECCPLCCEQLKWVYDGNVWIPCNIEPKMFRRQIGSSLNMVKKKELIEGCELYKGGSPEGFTYGLIPHVYTCTELMKGLSL